MATTKEITEENQHWHEDHLRWKADIEQWQGETHRLVALLYMLEKTLPEHSSKLKDHLALIDQHELKISQYRTRLDQSSSVSSSDVSIERQSEFHTALGKLHDKARQQHVELKQAYSKEMDKFRDLARKLLEETLEH